MAKIDCVNGCYLYTFDKGHGIRISEDCLIPATNTLKEFDPVMVSDDGEDWYFKLYKYSNRIYSNISINQENVAASFWKYIVPFSDFDFKDLESNVKRSLI